MKVFLISGKMRSGKNQFATYLREELEKRNFNVKEEFFAKTLKDECNDVFKPLEKYLNNWVNCFKSRFENIYAFTKPIYKELDKLKIEKENWFENKTGITRILLQLYGTEIFRNKVDDNWWIKKLISKLKSYSCDYVLITDVRFKNEIELLEDEFDCIKVRINRDNRLGVENEEHISEKQLDDYGDWDFIINNNETLFQLIQKTKKIVDNILEKE